MHPTRIFKSQEALEKAWKEYKAFRIKEAEQWPKVQYVGKDGERKEDAQKLPLTMDGFEIFCYNNYGCVNHYFDNSEDQYNDFRTICSRIRKEIRDNQIIGGLLGQFNPSITQRLNGLKESQEINVTGVPIMNVDPLGDGK